MPTVCLHGIDAVSVVQLLNLYIPEFPTCPLLLCCWSLRVFFFDLLFLRFFPRAFLSLAISRRRAADFNFWPEIMPGCNHR